MTNIILLEAPKHVERPRQRQPGMLASLFLILLGLIVDAALGDPTKARK